MKSTNVKHNSCFILFVYRDHYVQLHNSGIVLGTNIALSRPKNVCILKPYYCGVNTAAHPYKYSRMAMSMPTSVMGVFTVLWAADASCFSLQ